MSAPDPIEAEDPYRIPETELVEAPLVEVVESASKWRRFFNWLIDRLVIYSLIFAVIVLAYAFGGDQVVAWVDGIDTLTEYAITYATMLAYYTIMEGVLGFSVGKLVTGTRAVDAQGRRLTFGRGLLRSLCRLIPFDAVSLLLSDDDVRRAWHDSITDTYVVRRNGRPQSPPQATIERELRQRSVQGFTVSDSTTMSST
jgi:uncharacterized RDD family membrane protein YckC